MSNSFLFIIPLTPHSHLTTLRQELQQICFKTLLCQTYSNWTALIIGEKKPEGTGDKRFIHIDKEGFKELKLQWATQYIRENNLTPNYIIRLDDDDIINPTILSKYAQSNADAIVDAKHWFLEWSSMSVSNEFRPWFSNTFFHRFDHAMTTYGKLSKDSVAIVNESICLIENSHAFMHEYYFNKNVVFEVDAPIYLRVLNRDSITSNAGQSYEAYLSYFGLWKSEMPKDFQFLPDKRKDINLVHKSLLNKVKYRIHQTKESYLFFKKFK